MNLIEQLNRDIAQRAAMKLAGKMGNPTGGSPSKSSTPKTPATPVNVNITTPPQNSVVSMGQTGQAAGTVPTPPVPSNPTTTMALQPMQPTGAAKPSFNVS